MFNKLVLIALSLLLITSTSSCSKTKDDVVIESSSENSVTINDNIVTTSNDNNDTITVTTSKSDVGLSIKEESLLFENEEIVLDYDSPFGEEVISISDYDARTLFKALLNIVNTTSCSIVATATEISNGCSSSYPIIDIIDFENNRQYHKSSLLGSIVDMFVDDYTCYSYDLESEDFIEDSENYVDSISLNNDFILYNEVLNAPVLYSNDIIIDNKNYVRVVVDSNYIKIIKPSKTYVYLENDELKFMILIKDNFSLALSFSEFTNEVNDEYFIDLDEKVNSGID